MTMILDINQFHEAMVRYKILFLYANVQDVVYFHFQMNI